MDSPAASSLSIVHGIPLQDEPGLGSLTIPGYLREVTSRYAEREALVMPTPHVHRKTTLVHAGCGRPVELRYYCPHCAGRVPGRAVELRRRCAAGRATRRA